MVHVFKISVLDLAKNFISFLIDCIYTIWAKVRFYLCSKSWANHYFLKHLKCYVLALGVIAIANPVTAQTTVKGKVTDKHNHPIVDASIYIKGGLEGASTDTAGEFAFRIDVKGEVTFVASSVGFKENEKTISIGDTVTNLNFVLLPQEKALDPVVVSAGSFEASDKAKGASLTPIDAMTVAGNGGDISNSLRALPGAQQIGDREGLFVRGGTGEETKQFVDGTVLKNPNYPSVPGIIQPARINPFLFKGVLFSTGGYSALYGEALSSALILESVDLPSKSSASVHIFPMVAGAGIQELSRNKTSSYGVNANYGSYALYNKIIPQTQDFYVGPDYISADANFRIATGKTGMLKFYTNYGYNNTGMRNPDIDSVELLSSFQTKGGNAYANLSYGTSLNNKWNMHAGIAYNYNTQDVFNNLEDKSNRQLQIPYYPFTEKNYRTEIKSNFAQARIVFTRKFAHNQAIRFGMEHFFSNDGYSNNDTLTRLQDNLTAEFAETDLYISKNIAAKIGERGEYSSLLGELNLAPRISFAYRFYNGGQINLAYGIFYQKPELDYLVVNSNLTYAKATHYIANYQRKANNRLFRIEAYYKKYKNLVTTTPIENDGSGYAKGIELFFRDKRTFKNFDYWISYTYLDTKRKFLNYPYELQPNFATPHTASIAIKRFFPKNNFDANLSYSFATGRPYYDIRTNDDGKSKVYDHGTTNIYSQMNLSFAYLVSLFKKWKNKDFSGIGFGINNVLGTKEIFNYEYSYNGLHKTPVVMPATRSYYIGLFMTFGIDRRQDILDQNL